MMTGGARGAESVPVLAGLRPLASGDGAVDGVTTLERAEDALCERFKGVLQQRNKRESQ